MRAFINFCTILIAYAYLEQSGSNSLSVLRWQRDDLYKSLIVRKPASAVYVQGWGTISGLGGPISAETDCPGGPISTGRGTKYFVTRQ